jgi:uncharacterized protein YbcV (DUF1398 family)
MFTLDQIKAAHSKVKSGADFPRYVQDLIQLGVSSYETFVADGNTIYKGQDNETVHSGAKYPALAVSDQSNKHQFTTDLKLHQQGGSDYPTFCQQSAAHGIEKWRSDLGKMTCTYYDKAGTEILVETIVC